MQHKYVKTYMVSVMKDGGSWSSFMVPANSYEKALEAARDKYPEIELHKINIKDVQRPWKEFINEKAW